jgi:hypothetical protein
VKREDASEAIFGASDGLVACLGIVLAESTQGRHAVLLAAVGLLVAEGLGMAVSDYLSDNGRGLRGAAVMGTSTSATIVLPALPWLAIAGGIAVAASSLLGLALAVAIGRLRGGARRDYLTTVGLLAGVAAVATAAGHFLR